MACPSPGCWADGVPAASKATTSAQRWWERRRDGESSDGRAGLYDVGRFETWHYDGHFETRQDDGCLFKTELDDNSHYLSCRDHDSHLEAEILLAGAKTAARTWRPGATILLAAPRRRREPGGRGRPSFWRRQDGGENLEAVGGHPSGGAQNGGVNLGAVDNGARLEAMDDGARLEAVDDGARLEAVDDGARLEAVDDGECLEAVGDCARLEAADGESLKAEGEDDGTSSSITSGLRPRVRYRPRYRPRPRFSPHGFRTSALDLCHGSHGSQPSHQPAYTTPSCRCTVRVNCNKETSSPLCLLRAIVKRLKPYHTAT
ncbi:uncharacterized protein LOC144093112 [Stigmatopora argus]